MFFGCLSLNLINDVQGTPIIPLKVCPTNINEPALLLDLFKEAVSYETNQFLFPDLLEMFLNFFTQCQSKLAAANHFFNQFSVRFCASVLIFFLNIHACPAVSFANMLYKVGTITDRLTFERKDERAWSQIEPVRTANLTTKKNVNTIVSGFP